MIDSIIEKIGDSRRSNSENTGGKTWPYIAFGLTATAVMCTILYKNQRCNQHSGNIIDSQNALNSAPSKSYKSQPYNAVSLRQVGSSTSSSVHSSSTPVSSPYMGTRIPSFSRLSTVREQSNSKGDDDGSNSGVGNNHTWTALGLEQPLVIAMVGLPARGKSYLVKMIIRYLKWTGFECQVFNVGSFRRQVGLASADSNFFDNSNPNNHKIREQLAMMVQDSMYKWLHATNGEKRRVAVFDATNTTKERRFALAQRAEQENVFLLFVESICDDQEVLKKNYELKLQNDDYKGMDIDTARRDFISRVKQYERVYETVTDDENNGNIAYIKLINVSQKVITRNCHGYLPSQVAFYLQNVHINPRKIYLSVICHTTEVSENVSGTETGALTEDAEAYVNALADFMIYEQEYDLVEKGKEILVLTGMAGIHERSVAGLKQRQFRVYHTPILNELRGGDLHGLSKMAMKALYPAEYEKRVADKLNYRYPGVGGESYLDVIERVRPVIIELERQRRSILVVGHIAVLRCIYAYFMGVPLPEIPFKEFKYHHIYELEPGPFGCTCTIIQPHLHVDPLPLPIPVPLAPMSTGLPQGMGTVNISSNVPSRVVSRTPTPRPSVILETQYHSMQPTEHVPSPIVPLAVTSSNIPTIINSNPSGGENSNSASVPATPSRAVAAASSSQTPRSPMRTVGSTNIDVANNSPFDVPDTGVFYLDETTSNPVASMHNTIGFSCTPNPLGVEIERVTNSFDVPRGRLGSYDGNLTPRLEAMSKYADQQAEDNVIDHGTYDVSHGNHTVNNTNNVEGDSDAMYTLSENVENEEIRKRTKGGKRSLMMPNLPLAEVQSS